MVLNWTVMFFKSPRLKRYRKMLRKIRRGNVTQVISEISIIWMNGVSNILLNKR